MESCVICDDGVNFRGVAARRGRGSMWRVVGKLVGEDDVKC